MYKHVENVLKNKESDDKIDLNVEHSDEIQAALEHILMPYSTRGQFRTARYYGGNQCFIRTKRDKWSELFQNLPTPDHEDAMTKLSGK